MKTKNAFNEKGFFTFEDVENCCFKLLMQRKEIATRLATRFPLIIIDECQDLSPVQIELLSILRENGTRLILVGDINLYMVLDKLILNIYLNMLDEMI